jgi:HD-GYP domain-containing protein (c-di-GMP phosphodiesterase class II)
VAVADAFDAMTSDRPYRKGMPPWEALEEIVSKAGKQFDPEVVEAFKRVITAKMEKV